MYLSIRKTDGIHSHVGIYVYDGIDNSVDNAICHTDSTSDNVNDDDHDKIDDSNDDDDNIFCLESFVSIRFDTKSYKIELIIMHYYSNPYRPEPDF